MAPEQQKCIKELSRLFEIFQASEAELRPHFILTGASGTGKSFNIKMLAEKFDLGFLEINAAQLTKEGTSGNSLSKAMTPLMNMQQQLTVCFVDEFDKLFIAGNNNSELAHESTNGVQNEFLKILESECTSVFGDYGKYVDVPVKNVLFVFAGAFNGEPDINLDKLRAFGVKTEFLGRVGLVYNTTKVSLDTLLNILKESKTLAMYLDLFSEVKREKAIADISKHIRENYEMNTLGIRMVNTLITQYFIQDGKLNREEAKHSTFQSKLKFGE